MIRKTITFHDIDGNVVTDDFYFNLTEAEMLELAKAGEIPPLPERGLPDPARLQSILDRALAKA